MKFSEYLKEKFYSFYYWLVPHHLRPRELWYRFKCRVWHKYSTVRAQYLPHTWVDRCELLPHIMFQVLTDFIEKEDPFEGHIDWDSDDDHRHAKAEMLELYHWWHDIYQKVDPYEDNFKNIARPKELFIPYQKDDNGEVLSYEWGSEFQSPEHEKAYDAAMKKWQEDRLNLEQALKNNCKRLIEVMDYMWT